MSVGWRNEKGMNGGRVGDNDDDVSCDCDIKLPRKETFETDWQNQRDKSVGEEEAEEDM